MNTPIACSGQVCRSHHPRAVPHSRQLHRPTPTLYCLLIAGVQFSAQVFGQNWDVLDREKKLLCLKVLIGIFVDIYKNAFISI